MIDPDANLVDFLRGSGLAQGDECGNWTPLSGGVSSDIWRVETSRGAVCVKRALAQLKVAAEWYAPVGRNAMEWAYMQVAGEIAPGAVPRPLAHDPARGLFAMEWLRPQDHRLWKSELLAGRVDPAFAKAMGALLGRIHAATACDPDIPARFATDESFDALRIEPYLRATAHAHPDRAEAIEAIALATASTRRVLVHGDVSPKNILCGPHGPVLLDAECAWFGDPAFDLAFVLNHLVIKARVVAGADRALRASFDALRDAYLQAVDWEPREELEARAANLLAALALARVDGKSPLEYLDEAQRQGLRAAALAALAAGARTLEQVRDILLSGGTSEHEEELRG